MTSKEIKKIIDLVEENNQKNNAEIVGSLLAIGLKLERLGLLEQQNEMFRLENIDLGIHNDKLKKFIDFLKLNFDISLDSKLRISDGSECVQTFIIDLPENTTIDEMFEIIEEVLGYEY